MSEQFTDRTELPAKVETLSSGAIRVRANVTRTGLFLYPNRKGAERQYRPPEEVFAVESLESLRDIPVTVAHPKESEVNPENAKDVIVGHVGGAGAPEGDRFVRAPVVVWDPDVAPLVLRGGDVSLGYSATLDMTSGVTPDGEEFDAIQRNIRYNHLSLLLPGEGRAGPEVRILLDSEDADRTVAMKVLINGKEVEKGSAEHVAELEILANDLGKKIVDSQKETRAARAAAHARADLVARARVILGRPNYLDAADPASADVSNESIMAEIVKTRFPDFSAAGKSADFLLGMVSAITMIGNPPAIAAVPTDTAIEEPRTPAITDSVPAEFRASGPVVDDTSNLAQAVKERNEMIRKRKV